MKRIYPLILLMVTVTALSITGCTKDEEQLAEHVAEDAAEMAVDVYCPPAAPLVREIVEDIQKAETHNT